MKNWIDIGGKTALVTGASRGIGRAVAVALARQGARIAVHYRANRTAAEQTLAALDGTDHLAMAADLSDPQAAEGLIEQTTNALRSIDILVNNAGIYHPHPMEGLPFGEWQDIWQRTVSTNLAAPANLMFLTARQMKRQGGGRMVNISSRGAFRGEPGAPAYGASKAGLNALSQSLAQALAPHRIFVTCIAPGFVETDMAQEILSGPQGDDIRNQSPLGRVARPEEVADLVVYLASGRADFLTGGIIDINGASYLRS